MLYLNRERDSGFFMYSLAQSRFEVANRYFSHNRNEPFYLGDNMSKGKKGFQKGHLGFRPRIRIKKICLYCKKDIYVTKSLIKIGSGKFCDMKCYANWQSQNRRLEKSYTWKGGAEDTYRRIARNIIRSLSIPLICSICGREKSIIIHHLDKNVKNNNILNLKILCQSCHVKLHNKNEHKTFKDRAKHFICCICRKDFIDYPNQDRKVCSSACSYKYSKRGLHWRNRAH